jgi:ribosomal protein S27AE
MASSDWWAQKLGGAKGPTPVSTPSVGPSQGNVYRPPAQTPNVQVSYDAQQDQTISKAVSSRVSQTCPNCLSGNYFAPMGTQRLRCYDCGYPVVQSGSGAGMPSESSGPTQKAKQVGSSGFNPNIIVDRIG